MITLLSKDYHIQQAEMRPNVIMALLAGIQACSSPMTLPPRLVKYLAKTFGAWHIATEMLECPLTYVREDEIVVRDTIYDSLAEEDVFYGLWRRRAQWRQSYVPAVVRLSFSSECGWQVINTHWTASLINVISYERAYCLYPRATLEERRSLLVHCPYSTWSDRTAEISNMLNYGCGTIRRTWSSVSRMAPR